MNHSNQARALRPHVKTDFGRVAGMSRFAWYRSATRPADIYLKTVINDLLPGERTAFIPGVMGFLGCYVRQLLRGRRSPGQAAMVCSVDRRACP